MSGRTLPPSENHNDRFLKGKITETQTDITIIKYLIKQYIIGSQHAKSWKSLTGRTINS